MVNMLKWAWSMTRVSNALVGKQSCRRQAVFVTRKLRSGFESENLWRRSYSLETKRRSSKTVSGDNTEISLVRNIGIMAHIDAGKTTTTERILYYSGLTRHLGDVDDGNTVTDYMDQERERGITIVSAAVSLFWKKHRINLIDTPGHVDFTLEVERSLRVLDGAIAIIDASAGVEAQTLTVWRQADRYNIPRIVYVNKMDKATADFQASIDSVSSKLSVIPIPVQYPVGVGSKFVGIADLIGMKIYTWNRDNSLSDGLDFEVKNLDQSSKDSVNYDAVIEARNHMIEQMIELDSELADSYLSVEDTSQLSPSVLRSAMRRITLSQLAVPVVFGSSLKNCAVQPLLDAVVDFLPDPVERQRTVHPAIAHYNNDLCALAFKTVHDRQRGALTFVRVYTGAMSAGSTIYNASRDCTEQAARIYQVFADEHRDIAQVTAGNIAAVSGLKQTVTGDTLVSSLRSAVAASKSYHQSNTVNDKAEDTSVPLILAGMAIPRPVFFCSIEPPSIGFQKQLDKALEILAREDPSLQVSYEKDTGQTILGGMGELHLEIIHDRIKKEFGVDAYMGPLQIAYRETISKTAINSQTVDKKIGDKQNSATVCLSVHPTFDPVLKDEASQRPEFKIAPHKNSVLSEKPPRHDQLKAIENGITSGLARGSILGCPVMGVSTVLHELQVAPGTASSIITACVAQCIYQALESAAPALLEPIMSLEITVDEHRVGVVMADLGQRRSKSIEIAHRKDTRIVSALVPLAELRQYATVLRTKTSGLASLTMQLSHYEQMSRDSEQDVIRSITGSG